MSIKVVELLKRNRELFEAKRKDKAEVNVLKRERGWAGAEGFG